MEWRTFESYGRRIILKDGTPGGRDYSDATKYIDSYRDGSRSVDMLVDYVRVWQAGPATTEAQQLSLGSNNSWSLAAAGSQQQLKLNPATTGLQATAEIN